MLAPLTEATEKVSRLPLQADVRPVMRPGVDGTEVTTTLYVCGKELPQVLFAVTETVPEEPALPVIAFITEPAVVQPFGSVHV